jgi:hypothetical protein
MDIVLKYKISELKKKTATTTKQEQQQHIKERNSNITLDMQCTSTIQNNFSLISCINNNGSTSNKYSCSYSRLFEAVWKTKN